MAGITKVHGFAANVVGTIIATNAHKAFLITVKDDSNTAIDLTATDGTVNGNLNKLVDALSPAMFFATNSNAGTVSVIMDGTANTAESLQARVRAIFESTAGANDSTVVDGSSVTVA